MHKEFNTIFIASMLVCSTHKALQFLLSYGRVFALKKVLSLKMKFTYSVDWQYISNSVVQCPLCSEGNEICINRGLMTPLVGLMSVYMLLLLFTEQSALLVCSGIT